MKSFVYFIYNLNYIISHNWYAFLIFFSIFFCIIQQRFNVDECHKSIIFQMAGRCWKQYKSKITSKIQEVSTSENLKEAIASISPHNIRLDEAWKKFVDERLST